MNSGIFKLKPNNLPVYIYHLIAKIALVHYGAVYKLKGYRFSSVKVASNQPLVIGDCISSNSCYFGNDNIEVIPHLCEKNILDGVEKGLRYYYGCQINRMTISYVDGDYKWDSCGIGECTVFIELSDTTLADRIKEFEKYDPDELSKADRATLASLRKEWCDVDKLDYWKKRIPNWDDRLEYIGEIPYNLIY